MVGLSQAASVIVGFYFATWSAGALFLMQPPFFEVLATLTAGDGVTPDQLRKMLGTVVLVLGAIALALFTFAIKG